jgi:3-hydroxybutyryl-CoA dehydrogenase
MTIAVLADDELKAEFLQKGIPEGVDIIWADTLKVLYSVSDIDVYFDLLFNMDPERISRLKKLQEKPVFINAVNYTLSETGLSLIRINAWPTMLKRNITELVIREPLHETIVIDIFKVLQWQHQFVPDVTGMITPRVIAMIINEAYFTLEQNVSTKEEIDVAMKLGTNYPFGPFEWSQKIGLKNIYSLLEKLSLTDKRYSPSELLKKEANA